MPLPFVYIGSNRDIAHIRTHLPEGEGHNLPNILFSQSVLATFLSLYRSYLLLQHDHSQPNKASSRSAPRRPETPSTSTITITQQRTFDIHIGLVLPIHQIARYNYVFAHAILKIFRCVTGRDWSGAQTQQNNILKDVMFCSSFEKLYCGQSLQTRPSF